MFVFIAPLFGITMVSIFWSMVKFFRRDSYLFENIVSSTIILVFMIEPVIISGVFSLFNCKEIFNNDDYYLAEDYDIKCWDGDHIYYALGFGIPTILIWILGLPFALFIRIFKQRNNLRR